MVKHRNVLYRQLLALLLVFTLVLSSFSSLITAEERDSFSLGEITKETALNISPGVTQTKMEVTTDYGPLKIYNMDIDTKNPYVELEVGSSNGKLAGFQTVTNQAALISKPGYQVIGGINGDFYNTSNGVPIEGVIHDGRIMRSTGSRPVVAILDNGEVMLEKITTSIEMQVTPVQTEASVSETPILEDQSNTEEAGAEESQDQDTPTEEQEIEEPNAEESPTSETPPTEEESTLEEKPENEVPTENPTIDENPTKAEESTQETVIGTQPLVEPITHKINGINRERGSNSLVIFNQDYDTSTYTNTNGTEVILENVSDVLKPSGEVTTTVKEVLSNQGNTSLTEGQFVLSGEGTSKEILDSLQPGDQIIIKTTTNAPFDKVDEAVGGYHLLVKDGDAVASTDPYKHPRTALGVKADGSVFFTVIDGRQPGFSEGVTLNDLGKIMKDLGAVDAINLDGGGSTTFVARQPGDRHLSVVNSPSDGSQRNVANSLLVVSTAPSEGAIKHITVLPSETRILAGSHTSFEVKAQDEFYNPATITEDVIFTANAGLGEFSSHVFQAGATAGMGVITATTHSISSTAKVEVVDTLDRIEVSQTELALGPGDERKVLVNAYHNNLPVITDETAFTYEVEGEIGTIDSKGNFKAVEGAASGVINVRYGELVQEIKVDIGKPPIILEDFEDGIEGWTKSGARYNSIAISANKPGDPIRFGQGSLRLDYDFTGQKGTSGAYAYPVNDIEIEGYPEKIGLWFYGANDGHWLRAQLRDGSGSAFPVDFTGEKTGVNWEGWKYIEANVPKGKQTPLKLDLAIRVMETSDGNKNAATVFLDNFRAVYGETNDDLINPSLTEAFPADGATTPAAQPTISIIAKDNVGGTGIDPTKTVMKVDGEVVEHIYDPVTGRVSFMPESFLTAGYHEASVFVKDGFENPTELTWSFFISAGTEYVMEGPEKVYAGEEFNVDLKVKGIKELKETQVKILFDPAVVKVVDQDNTTAGVQINAGPNITAENIEVLSVDNTTGEIIINTTKLDGNTSLSATDVIAKIPFKASSITNHEIKIELKNGLFTYVRGDEKKTFHKPYISPIAYKFTTDIKGLSIDSHSIVTVKNEEGAPIEGAEVNILNPSSITKYAEVLTDTAPIYKNADNQSEVLTSLEKSTLVYVKGEGDSFIEVYLKNGSIGYVLASEVAVNTMPSPLGVTDTNGELKTNLLSLAELDFEIQAVKEGQVSTVKAFTIVPQLGIEKPEHVILSWKESPKTTQSVTWRTLPTITNSVIQFVKSSEFTSFDAENVQQVHGESQLVVDVSGEMRIHEGTVRNLSPNTTYTYRVGSGTEHGWSDPYTFTTEPETNEPFTFLFTADSQAANWEGNQIYGQVFNAARTKYPEAKFMLHGGDIVDDAAKMEQWEYFFDAIEGQTANLPMQAVLGNHDVYGEGENFFKAFFANPENGLAGEEEWVYSFDYGDVHFAMLNSEFGADSMQAQAEWLRQDMSNTDKKWKVVMFHRAPYHSNPLRGADATLKIFAPVIEELGVDLALVGHDHAYARTYSMNDGVPVEKGEGTLYMIGGSSGPKFYPEEKYSYIDFLYGEDKQVFSAIKVDGNKLIIETTNIDGEVVDSFELSKAKLASKTEFIGSGVTEGVIKKDGQAVHAAITIEDLEQIQGMEFILEFTPDTLKLQEGELADIIDFGAFEGTDFQLISDTSKLDEGKLTVSFASKTVVNGDAIITIPLTVIGENNEEASVSFKDAKVVSSEIVSTDVPESSVTATILVEPGITGKVSLEGRDGDYDAASNTTINDNSGARIVAMKVDIETNKVKKAGEFVTDASGEYTMNLEPGHYMFFADRDRYLSAMAINKNIEETERPYIFNVVEGESLEIHFNLLTGDTQATAISAEDDVIQLLDLTKFVDEYMETAEFSDFNGSEQVDGTDFIYLAKNYKENGVLHTYEVGTLDDFISLLEEQGLSVITE